MCVSHFMLGQPVLSDSNNMCVCTHTCAHTGICIVKGVTVLTVPLSGMTIFSVLTLYLYLLHGRAWFLWHCQNLNFARDIRDPNYAMGS